MKLTTYVNFPGNCRQALQFYEKQLGGKTVMLSTYEHMPEPRTIPPGLEMGSVLHARIVIGDTILMASDGPPERVQPMRSAYLSLTVDSNEEAERIYAALTDGGEVFMPIAETFFAHRFAMFRDKFGANWMLVHERPMPRNA
ncbi:MAG: VOC family protein [Terracidiphilus sp.]|jgi:PhnB protein